MAVPFTVHNNEMLTQYTLHSALCAQYLCEIIAPFQPQPVFCPVSSREQRHGHADNAHKNPDGPVEAAWKVSRHTGQIPTLTEYSVLKIMCVWMRPYTLYPPLWHADG